MINLILAVDSTGRAASCALVNEEGILGEIFMNVGLTHSETLMPMIGDLLRSCGVGIGDIDVFALSNGPGSFTGLRIGASTVMGLARGQGKKVVPVSTLDALAYNVTNTTDGPVAAIMDARRGQVYGAVYKGKASQLMRQTEYFALPIEDVIGMVDSRALFLGDGAKVHEKAIIEAGHWLSPINLRLQRAGCVGLLALDRINEAVEPGSVVPFYLRPSSASRRFSGD